MTLPVDSPSQIWRVTQLWHQLSCCPYFRFQQ